MRIKFTYKNGETTKREGALLAVSSRSSYTSGLGLLFLVQEDGVDHPKTFLNERMHDVQTYPEPDPVDQAFQKVAESLTGVADAIAALHEAVRK
jgi:hypothetical protein